MNPQDPLQPLSPLPQPVQPPLPVQPTVLTPGSMPQQPTAVAQPYPPQPLPQFAQPIVQAPQPFAQPVMPQPAQQYYGPPQKSSNKKLIIIILAVILVPLILGLIGFGALVALAGKNSTPTYKEFATYTNSKASKGSSYSIEHPVQFTVENEFATSTDITHSVDSTKDKAVTSDYAQISINSNFTGERGMEIIKEQFGDKNSEVRKAFDDDSRDQFKNYQNVTIGEPQAVPDVKGKKAYVVDYSYDYDTTTRIFGKALIVLGKERVYSVDVGAIAKVWDRNPDAWERILNSFTIDL